MFLQIPMLVKLTGEIDQYCTFSESSSHIYPLLIGNIVDTFGSPHNHNIVSQTLISSVVASSNAPWKWPPSRSKQKSPLICLRIFSNAMSFIFIQPGSRCSPEEKWGQLSNSGNYKAVGRFFNSTYWGRGSILRSILQYPRGSFMRLSSSYPLWTAV